MECILRQARGGRIFWLSVVIVESSVVLASVRLS